MSVPAQTAGDLPADVKVPGMREQPRFSAAIDLVALPTAAKVARLFVADTLRRWGAMFIEPDMEAVAAELVALSVKATGPAEGTSWQDIRTIGTIRVCLVGWRRHIVVEVSDEHDQELVLPEEAELPHDSGLGLVDARADRWGSCLTYSGRVMWAELAVYERTGAGLPRRNPKPTPHPRAPLPTQDPDLLQRVLNGLKNK
ncbi:ATP-binding protein [Amycolatopsis sp. lyj-109]|uniref:ATP-binding protein n=1 Tax=Amycolatopsis sp. lyj-109 TaxID=2789287 RepID=UPI00397A050F